MVKKSALDGLIGKLEKELDLPTIKEPTVAIGGGIGAQAIGIGIGALAITNPFVSPNRNPVMSPSKALSRRRTTKANVPSPDPFNMKSKVNQARKARQAEILRRHNLAKSRMPFDEGDEDQDQDLKENLDFVDENKYKTMEWTEPDGSITKLKFDEDGTLIGKETTKSRPDKFSRDLKKAVDKNAVALKDYEESLMTDPVQ